MEGVPIPGEGEEDRPIPNYENMFSNFASDLARTRSQVSELKRKERDWLGEKEALLKTSLETDEGNKRIKLEISELKDKEGDWIREKEDLVNQLGQKDQDLEGSRSEAGELKGRVSSLEDQLQEERAKSRQLRMEKGKLVQMAKEEFQKSADEFKKSVDKMQERAKNLEVSILADQEGGGTRNVRSPSGGFEGETTSNEVKGEGGSSEARPASLSKGTDGTETDNGSDKEGGMVKVEEEDADVVSRSEEIVNINVVASTPDLQDVLHPPPQNQNGSETSAQVKEATSTLRRSSRTRAPMVHQSQPSTSGKRSGVEAPSKKKDIRRGRQAVTLEAVVETFDDAKIAVEGGANSLVLLAAYDDDGLTPSFGFVSYIIASFPQIPIWVYISPANKFVLNQNDVEIMIRDMECFKTLEVEGFAFGALNSKDEVDEATCQQLIAAARPKKAYFHGAFERVPQAIPALNTIISLGFDGMMTYGQQEKSFSERVDCIKEIIQHGTNQIAITICPGLTAKNVLKFIKLTGAVSVQTSVAKRVGPINSKIRSEYGTGNDDRAESTHDSDRDE